MKNIINSAVLALILAVSVSLVPAVVSAQTNNGGDDDSAVAVSTKSATTNGGDDSQSSATTNSGSDSQSSTTTNGGDDSQSSSTKNGGDDNQSSGTNNGGDDSQSSVTTNGGDDSTFVAPTKQSDSNQSNDKPAEDTRHSRGGGRSRDNNVVLPILPILSNASSCSYLTTFMGINSENDSVEVTKLQTFLKNVEKLDVDINGTFDEKTLNAVKAFQEKYVDEVMTPWGVTTPTGQVFYTTQKKVNEIVCKTSLNLTAEQLSAIDAYKKSLENGNQTDSTIGDATSTNPVVGANDNGQTASVAKTSIAAKIWAFIKWLFGYDK